MDLSDVRLIIASAQLSPGYKFRILFRLPICMKNVFHSREVFFQTCFCCVQCYMCVTACRCLSGELKTENSFPRMNCVFILPDLSLTENTLSWPVVQAISFVPAVPLGIVSKFRMTSFPVSEFNADTTADTWLSLHPSPRTLLWC